MKKFFAIFLIFFLFPVNVFAQIKITEILPKPADKTGEFIHLKNNSCENQKLANFYLMIRGKKLSLQNEEITPNQEIIIDKNKYSFLLRDSGDTISIHNQNDEKIDEITYLSDEVLEGKILEFTTENIDCDMEEENTQS